MKRTFFDKAILIIIALMMVICIALASYTTYGTQKALLEEKQSNLVNEAHLLAEQAITPYLHQASSREYLKLRLDEYEEMLQLRVWFYDENGELIAASGDAEKEEKVPNNISTLDDSLDLKQGFSTTGTFDAYFGETMISVGVPVYLEENIVGYLILHTTMQEIDNMQSNMLKVLYMPFVVIMLVVGLVFIYLSGTLLRPIAKLNHAAREYAKGNFDVKTGVDQKDELGELAESLEYMASELSKLDEYRKNFIANISHDFRSPLTSIKGYLEAMLDGTIPPEKYNRYLLIVLDETKRLTKLTSGLLELNSFDNYGPILKCQNFDIEDMVWTTKNRLEGTCREKNITIRVICSTDNTEVYADKMKIGQVVNNLLDNAIKFSPEHGQITVSISEKYNKIYVSVKDEGPGIEKSSQNKVFDRFYKTDPSRGKDKKGTGLGLAITKEIIKAHGEHIDLYSVEGVGSEFVFTLAKDKKMK